ncbi:MotE family protein [Paenibacillus segetis]|uniref:Flagellar motility protein MotE, a chaperone for MotC folding n=1 Tax=Paenibacillus segetis TaxID=1325360 RepID=A0ABQ1Y9P9_9BACL|nr:hypothetical protein [Paenibacillus segetis]GGH17614.1 hypothetical protein GCM10008013_13050 [Paenibacillus segetis]
MAQAELEEEDYETGGGFSRFLFFVTPILFTVVLLGVLLTLFNMPFRDMMQGFAKNIPIVRNLIPDDEVAQTDIKDTQKDKEKDRKKQIESSEATIKQLKEQVTKQEADLKEANAQVVEQEGKLKDLQAELSASQQVAAKQELADEQEAYQKEVKKLAQLYAQMSPKKAAAILEKLTTDETLQMLSMMNNESKVAILEKMDAQKAADISILLKDTQPAEDLAIAALQSRLKKEAEAKTTTTNTNTGLSDQQLSATFASMSADSASALILQTYKISPDKALKILNAVNDSTRSKILESMAKADDVQTTKILNKLVSK